MGSQNFFYFIGILILAYSSAFARVSCLKSQSENSFLQSSRPEQVLRTLRQSQFSVYRNQKNSSQLARSIFRENFQLIFADARQSWLRLQETIDWKVIGRSRLQNYETEVIQNSDHFLIQFEKAVGNFDIFKVKISPESLVPIEFLFATNYQTAILLNSYLGRGPRIQRHFGIIRTESGNEKFDFGELVLFSLPEMVVISRSMSEKERALWINHSFDQLGSLSHQYHQRIHFALNYYHFREEPYQFRISKKLLSKLYDKGQLEINSYDFSEISKIGMGKVARTSFGIPVEFVLTKESLVELGPLLADQIKQGVLPF